MSKSIRSSFYKVHNYFVGPRISSSSFSSVRIAFHQITKENVIFKILSKQKMEAFQDGQEIIFSESRLYPCLKHFHISPVHEVIEINNQIFLVIEKEEICLNDLVETKLDFKQKLSLVDELLSAVEYLHDRHICHGDLKLENIMVDSNMRIKLIDFGFARFSTGLTSGKVGSIEYAAPEIFEYDQYDGKKADVFSLGIILFKIFRSENLKLSSLIRKMLDKNPQNRPDIHTIRQNDIFSELTFRVQNLSFDFDLFTPVKKVQDNSLNEVSCYLDISNEDLVSFLQSKDSNIFKLFYYLDQEKNCLPIHSQEQAKMIRQSCSLPDRLDFVDIEQMIVSNIFEQSKPQTIMRKAKNFFLKNCFCVSSKPRGGLNVVLNSKEEDSRIFLNFNEESSEGCELVVSFPQHHNEIISQLFQFL